jgi:hypothetical protein
VIAEVSAEARGLAGAGSVDWGGRSATDLSGTAGHEAQAMVLLAAFAEAARAQGLESCVYGLNSRALVLGAVGAGFRYVAGPAIHPDVTGLATALRFEPSDLYTDMTRAPPSR